MGRGRRRGMRLWVQPLTLRPASRPPRLQDENVSDFALSPDGVRLAVGSEADSRIELFDLRRRRSLGSAQLSGSDRQGGASGLVWASERRLLALAGAPHGRLVAEVDLQSRRLELRAVTEERSARQRVSELIEPQPTPRNRSRSAVPHRPDAAQRHHRCHRRGSGRNRCHSPAQDHPVRLRLIDPARWTSRTVDEDAQDMTVAGGALLARRWSCDDCINGLPSIGLRVYDTAGELRFTRFAGRENDRSGEPRASTPAPSTSPGAEHAGVHVIDLDTGDTVRQLPRQKLRLLNPD